MSDHRIFMEVSPSFFQQGALTGAKNLLGKYIVHETDEGRTIGRIVETEAYIGPDDKAAHSAGGKRTARTEIQFDSGGSIYVYLIYGMHVCLNIVMGPVGKPEVVLIRALEPIEGLDLMRTRRQTDAKRNLCNGPGKLTQAMGITMNDYGRPLVPPTLYIAEDPNSVQPDIWCSPRINIDYAEEYVSMPWRFFIFGNPYVSTVPKRFRDMAKQSDSNR